MQYPAPIVGRVIFSAVFSEPREIIEYHILLSDIYRDRIAAYQKAYREKKKSLAE